MKVKRFRMKGAAHPGDRGHYAFEASHPNGWIGVGSTPARAVLDMRHEYRQFADAAETGKCNQGRFHKW